MSVQSGEGDWLYNIVRFVTLGVHVCRDTICDLGGTSELANYGEYSGAPSEQQTYEYAKTVLGLMTKEIHPDGWFFLVLLSSLQVPRPAVTARRGIPSAFLNSYRTHYS